RGHLGGLARATGDAALVLDAAGKALIIIETVGVGQDEVDIIRTADISIVTLVPGTGDEVQALKAGIMEIADIFVINKADREGADRLVAAVEANLALETAAPNAWRPPVLKTTATAGKGVAELVDTIWRFREHSAGAQASRRRSRSEYRLRELVSQRFMDHLERDILAPGELASMVERIAARVRAHFVAVGGAKLELLEGTSPDSAIAKYIEKRGPGLHHITLRVDDIAQALARLKARGVRLIDEEPRSGAEGSLIAFVHPASTGGVLIELKQNGPHARA